jgi:ubiquinone/menaquinone biosynthesis C-methylase UbiE
MLMADHICPWWMGYLLMCPIRSWLENPEKQLKPLLEEKMTVLDIGSGMGFYTFPAARLVGKDGRVIAVDLQEKMLNSLKKRALKVGLADRVETRLCQTENINVTEPIDVCLAINVAHEVPDARKLFEQIAVILKPTGKLLLIEPKHHVSVADFQETIDLAGKEGFRVVGDPKFNKKLYAVLELIQEAA